MSIEWQFEGPLRTVRTFLDYITPLVENKNSRINNAKRKAHKTTFLVCLMGKTLVSRQVGQTGGWSDCRLVSWSAGRPVGKSTESTTHRQTLQKISDCVSSCSLPSRFLLCQILLIHKIDSVMSHFYKTNTIFAISGMWLHSYSYNLNVTRTFKVDVKHGTCNFRYFNSNL